MASLATESASPPPGSANNNTEALNTEQIISTIRESNKWRILVYGINNLNYKQEQNDHHMSLLSGILGEQISVAKKTLSSFSFEKNQVSVTVHVGSHTDCEVTPDDVDMLVLFHPTINDAIDESYATQINEITERRGALIWKHSMIILTGVDNVVDEYTRMDGKVATRLETVLKTWTTELQRALASAIGDEASVQKEDVLIVPAGRRDQPDLPRPHEKWFSQICLGCFTSSKDKSIPTAIKLAQGRISNNVTNETLLENDFHQQPIQAKENSIDLPQNLKVGLGLGGGGAIAGAAATGATIGALIGALAIGIPSFGVAAGTGLVLGAVVGGGVGAGIAGAAVGGSYKAAKNKQQEEITATDLKLYYAALITYIPKMCAYLRRWAESQVSCRIVVAGVKEEGVSTVAAALIGKEPRKGGSGLYWKQIVPMKANLVVHDFQSFPRVANKQEKAKELVAFQKSKDINLLIFCIPMTDSKADFVYSPHIKYLERLCEEVDDILSNTVIVLSHANEMRAEKRKRNDLSQTSFQQFFKNELAEWRKQIKTVLTKYHNIDGGIVDKIPVLPVGNVDPSIDLSDNEQPSPATQYHWLSEFLLLAMPATKPEGLPTLIKTNKKRVEKQPNEYHDRDRACELIIEAQCSMFSSVGLRDKKHPGKAIGHILGVNEIQDW